MFVESRQVTEHLQSILPLCDLVVGTEEELCIAGGSSDVRDSLVAIRERTAAAIVRKRGAQGSIVYPEAIPADLNEGVSATPFAVEVLNSTGAGDAYLAGFLLGWIREADWQTCCRYGNACGAMVVSRHACSAAMPSRRELDYFLSASDRPARLWEDKKLEQLHWVTRRRRDWPALRVLAFDHRWQFEESAHRNGRRDEDICEAKRLIAEALQNVVSRHSQVGAIIDEQYGSELLERLTGSGHWLARPIERVKTTPLEFVGGPDVGLTLRAWPQEHVVKCLVHYDLQCEPALRAAQDARLQTLFGACRNLGRELLLEILPTSAGSGGQFQIADVMRHLYGTGIVPDWWKIESPPDDTQWAAVAATIAEHDAECRGVILLGKGVPLPDLQTAFRAARKHSICKGFAVGRSIFHEPIDNWFRGANSADACRRAIEDNFETLIKTWDSSATG